jgi:hypothetical protein
MPERILWWFMDKAKIYIKPMWPTIKWILILIPFGIPLLMAIAFIRLTKPDYKE